MEEKPNRGFTPIRLFPSNRGLHAEFATREEAVAFYQQGVAVGNRNEITGCMVIMLASRARHSENPDSESSL
ncbi:MAG: hypothetical protein SWY16_26695 [Cyanobacteriota bacterium]|nr:hypothetical protein [Cyanobacteriota bacterium]